MRLIITITSILSFLFTSTFFAQKTKNDSIKTNKLEEVVITGQYSRQSVKKSVFDVTIINKATIEQNAANNLADLLNQTLNISITPNTKSGKSGVSLFGLDSQYVKILVDNIPVINEDGVGNNIDLTLINLDDIEQIEIVEGSMGVQYGANAVSGIINIITKKKSKYKLKISTSLQEETVGDEYEWFAKGRHIQSLKLDYNINDNLFANISFIRNDFGGFWNNQQGEIYDQDDNLRGHNWVPKENSNMKILLNYKKNNFNAFYKFGFLNETIEKYNPTVLLNEIPQTQTSNPTATDKIYTNKRFIHNFNANGRILTNKPFDFSLSYQSQVKDVESYTYIIRTDEKENVENNEYKSRSVIISRATLSNLINTDLFKMQIGYDVTLEKGTGTELSIFGGSSTQKLDLYDAFISTEFNINDKFSVRPGARISISNIFDNQFIYSLSSRYNFDNDLEFRAILGSANRSPNYTELFEHFLHPSHDIFGNEDLLPESGNSVFTHLKKKIQLKNHLRIENKLSLGYISLKDKIALLLYSHNPRDTYKFINVNKHETISMSLTNSLLYKNFKANLGIGFVGIAQYFEESNENQGDYLFSPNLNTSLFYNAKNINTSFALTYKYNGKVESYVLTQIDNNGNEIYGKGATDDFSLFDATIKKSFLDEKIQTTIGVRNILNVTQINTSSIFGGGLHNGQTLAIDMAYGRSYFIKLAYNFKQK